MPKSLIYHWRKANRKTQKELAFEADVHRTTVAKIERGQLIPGDDIFGRIGDVTGHTADELRRDTVGIAKRGIS